jgi:hypothetical protein
MHEHMFAFSADAVDRLAGIPERNVAAVDSPGTRASPLLLTPRTGSRPEPAQAVASAHFRRRCMLTFSCSW